MTALVQVAGLRLSLGAASLFEDAEFVLHRGERAAFVGANGAGKSTLMQMIAGNVDADAGEIVFASGVTVGFAPQEASFEGFATLRDYASAPSTGRLGSSAHAMAHRADALLQDFDLDPDRAPQRLSGGEARRASLARALAGDPDVLLLDEPTNHLDITAIEALEDRLSGFRGACLVISHDRRFLERTSNSIVWLRQRRLLKLNRGFAAFDDWAESIEQGDERALARLRTQLNAEERWLQRGVTARRSRNEGRRRKLMAMRAEQRERRSMTSKASAVLNADRGAESARLVIEAKGITKAFGGAPLINSFSLKIMRGDRVGIIGPNGSGKTTLVDLLLKRSDPDSGAVRLGENLETAYIDQNRAILDLNKTVWQTLAPGGGDQVIVRGRPRHVAAHARDFLFGSEQLRQPLSALSGGERNRLSLAVALARPANLLVLDEPTNDLDMDMLDVLEGMLADYDGTVVVVSHDRAFLDGVATQIVGPLGGGLWVETSGGWADFEREHGKPKGKAPEPKAGAKQSQGAAPPRRATKLGYKEERRAADLETLIPSLDSEISALERALSDPGAFARDASAYDTQAKRLAMARLQRAEAEDEWLEIELRREALSKRE